MAENELQPAVVDVPIGSLNNLPPDHAGPTGRLTALYDAIFTQYQQADSKRLQIDPRPGFASFSNVLRSHVGFGPESGTWASPSFLFALGDQLLSICSNIPRVFNGSDWTHYSTTRVVTQKLSESVLHSTNATIAACDHAWIAGVTCSVWTEQAFTSAGVLNTQSFVGIRADDGAWLLTPAALWPSLGGSSEYSLAKVVADGTNFWVFYNAEASGHKIFINVYDTTGTLVASNLTARNWNTSPGYWDILGLATGGVLLAQPQSFNGTPTDLGVNVKKFTYAASVITQALNVNNAGHCMGPLAWLTNDLSGTSVYLGTVNVSNRLWAYELNTSLAVTKEYDFNILPTLLPDNLTGWAVESGVGGQRDIFLSWSQLAGPAASTGPTFDPAYRFIKTVKRTFAGVTTTIRTTQSVIQQSRAFAINGEYYAYTYYQSGSGQSAQNAAQSVTVTDADYFIGDREQPLAVTGGAMYGAASTAQPEATGIFVFGGMTPKNIDGTGTADSVVATTSTGFAGLPDGTPILKWTFKNGVFPVQPGGAILKVNSSSIPTANFQWDVYAYTGATIVYTPTVNRVGGTVVPGNFTTTGTVELVDTVHYPFGNIDDLISADVAQLFVPNGTITVSGASNGGNNGTFTILRVTRQPTPFANNSIGGIWVSKTTQVNENPTGALIVITPAIPKTWNLGGQLFTNADLHSSLRVENNSVTANSGTFQVTGTPVNALLPTTGGDASGTVAQVFDVSSMPTFTLVLDDDGLRFTAAFSLFTFDYTYIGALLSITNAYHSNVNGVYKITDVLSAHIVRLEATNGTTGQRSEEWDSDLGLPTVSVLRNTNVQQQTQPEWFVTPLTGSQPQVGAFEKGLAYADWRLDGATSAAPDFGPQDHYRFALSSTSNPNAITNIRQVVLPFRVSNFTQVSIASVGATPIDIANLSTASTTGLKIFQSQGRGEGIGDAGKLLLPGLLTGEFTASGFAESNFNIGPEAPFLVSEGTDSTAFALTAGQTYTIQAVFATTLENGDVVRSLPSPPIQFTLTGTNNFAVYGGRLPLPLDSTGSPQVSKTFGLTNHAQVTIELYRSVLVDGVPSTQLHLITNPANPNGLYSSGTGSGFSFPDTFTWNYRDENPDAGIRATEVVYAGTLGQGIAPHYPPPPSKHATTWQNRRWVVGYDGAVWMSAEMVEGEDTWYFPGFRYPFPPEDPAVCVVGFESNLYMFCAHSIWRIGLTQLPNNTLTEGAMPPPVKMPWSMGCSGFAVAMSDAVAYSSSVGGGEQIWAITRNLANVWLSEPLSDLPQPVSAMTVDGRQRLIVLADSSLMRIYDPVAREWSVWRPPSPPDLVTTYQGQITYQDSGFVLQQTIAAFVDIRNAVTTTIAIDLTLSSLTFAQVRAVKRLWEVQIIGPTPVGSVNINAVISYPDELQQPPTTFGPTLASVLGNLLMAINPAIEDAGSFVIRIFGSYEGIITPGKCFSVEMLSCEVGVDAGQGVRKLPDGFRMVGS